MAKAETLTAEKLKLEQRRGSFGLIFSVQFDLIPGSYPVQIYRHSVGSILDLRANVLSRWSLLAFIFVGAISSVAMAGAQTTSTFNSGQSGSDQLSTSSSSGWG